MRIHKRAAKHFVRYFVPHKSNQYRPHFLRGEKVAITALTIVVLFAGTLFLERFVIIGDSPQVAAVVASTLVDLANRDRSSGDLSPLRVNATLQEVAQMKADDMAARGYFAHDTPDGHDPWYWFAKAGYDFTYAGENLAVYFTDSTDVNDAWMNSPEHRANILNDHFTEIGVATAEGVYQGRQTVFVVQEFGTPAASSDYVASASEPPEAQQVAAADSQPAAQIPRVAAASAKKAPITVIQKSANFIAVQRAVSAGAASVAPVPQSSLAVDFLNALTSPRADLRILYGIIGALVALALALEITVRMRRPHPHRIAFAFSLVCLMLFLLYTGDTLFVGHLLIA